MLRYAFLSLLLLLLSCADPAGPSGETSNFALRFDGIDDIACLNSLGVLPAPTITVAAWVRPDSATGTRLVFSREDAGDGRGFFFGVQNGRWMAGGNAGSGISLATFDSVAVGAWSHVTFVFDIGTTTITFFVNGPAGGTTIGVPSALNTGVINSTALGRHVLSVRDAFAGSVDDLAIWGRALDSAEVLHVMSADPLAVSGELFSWNPFSEGSGIYARDSVNMAAWAYLGRGNAEQVPDWARGRK
jgi:hypothetical protein